jgi:hypothetical protein
MNKPATKETVLPREISHFVNGKEVTGRVIDLAMSTTRRWVKSPAASPLPLKPKSLQRLKPLTKLFPPGPPRRP